jgi:hypothetical protein
LGRAMTTVKIENWGKGLNKDLLPAELELGYVSDSLNFRFRNGFAEKWEGFGTVVTGVSAPKWLGIHEAGSNSYLLWVNATGTAYAYNIVSGGGSGGTAITPYIFPKTISTLTRVNATTAEVTTTTPHGLSPVDTIIVFGAVEDGYNVAAATPITVINTTVFRYTVTSIAANATTVGEYVVVTSIATSEITESYDEKMSGGNLNGVSIINSSTNGMFYWAGDTSIKLRRFGVKTYISDVARPFKNYIVQLARTVNGTKKIFNVAWSASAEPGAVPTSFTASATNDAGEVDLAETPGRVVDCLALGGVNIVYKEDSYYAMQYVGGNDVFSFQKLSSNAGLRARSWVADTPVGHVFVTPDLDVRIHSGGESRSIANARVKAFMRTIADYQTVSEFNYGFVSVNRDKSEVCIFIRTLISGAGPGLSRVLAWNWVDDTWSLYDTTTGDKYAYAAVSGIWRATGRDALVVGRLAVIGSSHVSESLQATLTRVGMHFGDRDTFKSIQRSRWNIDGTAGEQHGVQHGSSKTADGSVSYTNSVSYILGTTDYCNARGTAGRFGAISFTTATSSNPLALRSVDLDVTAGGKR